VWLTRDAARRCGTEDPYMQATYGVVWREGTVPPAVGKLELLPRALRLEGLERSQQIPYEEVAAIRIGRTPSDRINGGPAVVVERRHGDPIIIATVAQPSLVGEIAERLAALQLGARPIGRIVVVLPLKRDAHDTVIRLLEAGPPFDPASIRGLDRHEVYLTSDEVVFVFESKLGADALAPLLADQRVWEAAAAWRECIAGAPRIAEDVFSWARGDLDEDVSYLPTPGPGDSDGGDIY
jgi:hypothetical protein